MYFTLVSNKLLHDYIYLIAIRHLFITFYYMYICLLLVPGTAPHSLKILNIQSSFATLSWMAPVVPNGIITQYELQYRRSSDSLTITTNITSTITGNTLISKVQGLLPFTKYELKLRAYTRVGAGPYSENLRTETLPERKFKFYDT